MNYRRAARALAEASITTDAAAARNLGCSVTAIRKWRVRLEKDPELRGVYADELARIDGRWRRELREVAVQAARDMQAIQRESTALVLSILRDPSAHTDEHGHEPDALQRLRVAAIALGDTRATLEKATEILVHYAALVSDGHSQTVGADGGTASGSGQGAERSAPVH